MYCCAVMSSLLLCQALKCGVIGTWCEAYSPVRAFQILLLGVPRIWHYFEQYTLWCLLRSLLCQAFMRCDWCEADSRACEKFPAFLFWASHAFDIVQNDDIMTREP